MNIIRKEIIIAYPFYHFSDDNNNHFINKEGEKKKAKNYTHLKHIEKNYNLRWSKVKDPLILTYKKKMIRLK